MGHLGHRGTAQRAGRGSLAGKLGARAGNSPSLHGALTIERDLRAGSKLWVSGYVRTVAGAEYLELVATISTGGPRKARGRRRRTAEADSEPIGRFRDAPASRLGVLHHVGPEQQPRGQSDEERDDQVVESVTHAER